MNKTIEKNTQTQLFVSGRWCRGASHYPLSPLSSQPQVWEVVFREKLKKIKKWFKKSNIWLKKIGPICLWRGPFQICSIQWSQNLSKKRWNFSIQFHNTCVYETGSLSKHATQNMWYANINRTYFTMRKKGRQSLSRHQLSRKKCDFVKKKKKTLKISSHPETSCTHPVVKFEFSIAA